MASFNGESFTYTRENASERDAELPNLNALSLSGIASTSGLGGLSGVDTSLIKGDRKEYLLGNQFTEREKNLTDITHLDENKLVMQSQQEQIMLNSVLQIGQDRWKTTKGNTLEHYVGSTSIVYMDRKEIEEPAELVHHVEEVFSFGTKHCDAFVGYALLASAALSGFVANVDVRGYNLGLLVAANEFKLFHHEEHAESISLVAMRQTIRVTEAFAMAVEPGVAAAFMHEVAVTQEIIAVGANQCF